MANNTYDFNLVNWSAWAVGELSECEAFIQLKHGEPLINDVSAMIKRRMPKLSKYIHALNNNTEQKYNDGNAPIVFTSKNAELCRTFKIIRSFGSDVSPAQFSMSVHNAIAGLLSVITKNTNVYTVIDSLSGSLEMAIVEAVSLLSEHKYVKIVYFDEQLPDELLLNFNCTDKPVVLTLLIKKGNDFSLSSDASIEKESEDLRNLLEFLSLNNKSYNSSIGRTTWQWENNTNV